MKTISLIIFLGFLWSTTFSQNRETNSLQELLILSDPDESRVDILLQLSSQHANIRPDSATIFAEQALSLAREIDFLKGEARALGILSYINRVLGDYPESFRQATKGLQIAKENNFIEEITLCLYGIGAVYSEGLNDHPKAIDYFKQAKEWERSATGVWNNVEVSLLLNGNIATSYLRSNALDSATVYFEKILPDSSAFMYPIILLLYGELQFELGNRQEALDYSQNAIQSLLTRDDHRSLADAYFYRASYFREMGQTDSCIYYAQRSLSEAESISYQPFILKATTLLAGIYEALNDPEALRYYKMAKLANDEVYGEKKVQELQRIITEELERQQEAEKARIAFRNRVRQNTLFGGLGAVLLVAFLLLRNNRQKRKANAVLESKNLELEIEAALERVRARTMGMQHSDELADAASVLYQQLLNLGIKPIACAFVIFDAEKQSGQVWIATGGRFYPDSFEHPYHGEPVQERLFAAWKQNRSFHLEDLSGQELITHLTFIAKNMPVGEMLEAAGDAQPNRLAIHAAYFSKGFLGINYPHPQPEQIELLKRFAKVFDQTYTRFLDLQKAEAQAREAQIEASLERLRARAMAMHRSEEIPEVLDVVFEQLKQLGFSSFHTVLGVFNPDETALEVWSKGLGAYRFPSRMVLPVTDHPHFRFWLNDRKERIEFNSWKSSGKVLRDWDDFVFGLPEMQHIPEEIKNNYRNIEEAYFHQAYLQHGILGANGPAPLPDEQISTLKRFARVLDLTYTRMLDLQKAEAQAREAQIEAALERVRSRTMAMRQSKELAEVASVLFEQLRSLGGSQYACGLVLCEDNNPVDEQWMYVDGAILPPQYIPHEEEPVHFEMFKAWQAGAELFEETVEGDQNQAMIEFLMAQPSVRKNFEKLIERMPVINWQKMHAAYFSQGYLLIVSLEEEDSAVYIRFAKVFEQTYTRFLDLQKAELRAVEAARTASLDRVRAEIASMRSPDDLQRITPLVWRELTTLGVPFFRCGVFIMNEAGERVHAYLSTPEGKPLAVLHLPFDGTETTRQTVDHWLKGEVYTDFWDRQQFLAWVRTISGQGLLRESHNYQGGDEPPESLALQFVPFAQGMLYVGSLEPLSGEQIDLLKRLADTFAVAYARYEDFNKLEEAKNQVESTLTELKATQAQLIQSEKLASLGELTAGIAHEIQNPLNFVNNFAELSAELVDEMQEELRQGNTEDAVDIASDLGQNLGKIHHHGQRASSIIRSMLQHSRASTGEKEATNINALVDEWIRLSYHGMRAQDRSFQADYQLDLADKLPELWVAPQDIGRVLLNLFNNAFYAVNEKRMAETGGTYHPLLRISTQHRDDAVEIRVQDNGAGIPEELREKIFQPFFTTKPTGHGTGLGLSLSYDIVTKGHGGTLEAPAIEEEGSLFIIRLPATKNK